MVISMKHCAVPTESNNNKFIGALWSFLFKKKKFMFTFSVTHQITKPPNQIKLALQNCLCLHLCLLASKSPSSLSLLTHFLTCYRHLISGQECVLGHCK